MTFLGLVVTSFPPSAQVLLLVRVGGLPSSMALVMEGSRLRQRSLSEHLCLALGKGKVGLGRGSSWGNVFQRFSTLDNIALQCFFGILLAVRVFY